MTTSIDIVVSKPFKSYIKTILGKVFVDAIDPITNDKVGLLLKGDPNRDEETCIVDTWDELSDLYFRRQNRRHFETGMLREYERKEKVRERTIEEFSDDELRDIINSKYMAYKNVVEKIESSAVLYRMIRLAEEMEKSEKIVGLLKKRQSELTALEYAPYMEDGNTQEE